MPADPHSSRLLRMLARPAQARDHTELTRSVEDIDDWRSCLALAREHRVSTMLYRGLAELGSAVPAYVVAELGAEFQRNYLQSLANAAELVQILKEFDGESIQAMPMKGVVLAASAYGDLAARAAGDLDVLVHYRDLARARALLEKHGYVLKTPTHPDGSPSVPNYFEYHFARPSDGMVIELRWRLELTQPRFPRKLGMDWVWPGHQTAKLAGAEVPDMNAETGLLVLCMHGSKHLWSRLSWICDVAQWIAARPQLDWDTVTRQARQNGLSRALALGVLLAARVTDVQVPQRVLRRFEADSPLTELARHFDKNLFDDPGSLPVSRIPYSIQILDNRDRARLLFSQEYWQPNERDLQSISLPKPLYPLYLLLRPFRVLLDRSPRL